MIHYAITAFMHLLITVFVDTECFCKSRRCAATKYISAIETSTDMATIDYFPHFFPTSSHSEKVKFLKTHIHYATAGAGIHSANYSLPHEPLTHCPSPDFFVLIKIDNTKRLNTEYLIKI